MTQKIRSTKEEVPPTQYGIYMIPSSATNSSTPQCVTLSAEGLMS